jgi:hypothetical protein
MQGLRIFSRAGNSLSADEISAANRVAITHKEMRFGVIKVTDQLTGVEVEYHPLKRIAFISSGLKFLYSRFVDSRCKCVSLHVAQVYVSGTLIGLPPPPPAESFTWTEINETIVFLSDGTVLGTNATEHYRNYVYVPPSSSIVWNSYMNSAFNQSAQFGAPHPQVAFFKSGEPFTLKNREYDLEAEEYIDSDGVTIEFEEPENLCLPSPDAEDFEAARVRYRQFRKACSDATLASLAIGEVPASIRVALEQYHPVSSIVEMTAVPLVTVSDEVDEVVGDDETIFTVTRSAVIEYETEEGMVTDTVVGTATITLTLHSVVGDPSTQKISYQAAFDNFIAIENGSTGIASLDGLWEDGVSAPNNFLGSPIINVPIEVADFDAPSYNSGYSPFVIDGVKVALKDDAEPTSEAINLDPVTFFEFSPEIPLPSNTTSISIPSIVIAYREQNKPVPISLEDAPDFGWLDARIANEELITIYPVQRSSNLGDLGLYPQEADEVEIIGCFVTKGYQFKYEYASSTYIFVKIVDIKDKRTGLISDRIDLPPLMTGGSGGGSATIEDALAELGLSTVEELYAIFGVSNEAEFLALLGILTMQEFIDTVVPPSEEAEIIVDNFVFLSERSPTKWTDVDQEYKNQPQDLSGAFNEADTFLTLEALYDFLS